MSTLVASTTLLVEMIYEYVVLPDRSAKNFDRTKGECHKHHDLEQASATRAQSHRRTKKRDPRRPKAQETQGLSLAESYDVSTQREGFRTHEKQI